jgi:outer membrane protein assembly factor BamB
MMKIIFWIKRYLQFANCQPACPAGRLLTALTIFLITLNSCKEEVVDYQANNCKRNPTFIQSFGYNPSFSYLTTSDEKIMGLVLRESSQAGNPNAPVTKQMQHPSWLTGGWLAPILIASNGDIFTSPAPFINILNNPISNNNTIYKVDGKTGVMEVFLKLPSSDSINTDNPFGIIGMALLCETNTLYVSSLAGSKRHNENGHIYAIDITNGKIIDQVNNTDAMGMGISYVTGKRKLYFGTGRSSDVFDISLDKNGKFVGKPSLAFTLQDLGIRGDDKVRKIRTDSKDNLVINAMEFNYNLIAPREKQESVYKFAFDEETKKWVFVQ